MDDLEKDDQQLLEGIDNAVGSRSLHHSLVARAAVLNNFRWACDLSQNCRKTPSVAPIRDVLVSEGRFPKLLETLKVDRNQRSRWSGLLLGSRFL